MPLAKEQEQDISPLYLGLCCLLLIFTAYSRFHDLGAKPPHHDESMQAFYSLDLLKTGHWESAPFFPGPFQFHGVAAMFFLFGDSTAHSRYLAASLGVLMVLMALLAWPLMGRTGAFLAATLMACSPTLMYFNRFCREDTPVAAGTLAFVIFLGLYLRSQKPRDLWLAALGFTVAYCSNVTFFISFFLFGLYLVFLLLLSADPVTPGINKGLSYWKDKFSLPTSLIAMTIMVGSYLLFHIGVDNSSSKGFPSWAQMNFSGPFGALLFWIQQSAVHRGDQPFYYYLVMLLAYEPFLFLATWVACVYYTAKPKALPLFFIVWAVGSLLLYSFHGERMPWLTFHIVMPAILLVGYFLGELWDRTAARVNGEPLRYGLTAVLGLVLILSASVAWRLCFHYASDPVEPYAYVQTSPDSLEVERIVRDIGAKEGLNTDLKMTIQDNCSWPFAWLFRDFEHRNHPPQVTETKDPVIITSIDTDAVHFDLLNKAGYVNRKYRLRAWWVYSWFKEGSSQNDRIGWNDLWKWEIDRQAWSPKGSFNFRLWIRGDLAKKYGFTDDHRTDIPSEYPRSKGRAGR